MKFGKCNGRSGVQVVRFTTQDKGKKLCITFGEITKARHANRITAERVFHYDDPQGVVGQNTGKYACRITLSAVPPEIHAEVVGQSWEMVRQTGEGIRVRKVMANSVL